MTVDGRRADAEAMNATNVADKFIGVHGEIPDQTSSLVYTEIPVLHFLWGRPWNNMALNYVMGLRPYRIRVTTGECTADACLWRVTVFLERDKRTIKRIEQEVQTWGIGCRYGADLKLHHERFKGKMVLEQSDFPPHLGGFINMKAVEKLNQVAGGEGTKEEQLEDVLNEIKTRKR